MKFLLLTLVCLTATISQVYSYQCYNCAAVLGKGEECEKNIKNSPTNECYKDGVCSTYVIKKTNVKLLTRACTTKDICSDLKKRFENNQDESLSQCDSCESELCNNKSTSSGPALLPSSAILSLSVLLVSLRLYR